MQLSPYQQYYTGPGSSAVGLGRNLRRQRLTEALAMAQGKMQPWNLPETRPMVEATRAQTESQMRYLPNILARAGVSGPAAGLAIERTGQAGTNNLFNLMNQIRQQQSGQGLGLAAGEEQAYQNLLGSELQRNQYDTSKEEFENQLNEQMREFNKQYSQQQKQAGWNRWMSAIQGIGQLGSGIMSGIGSLQSAGSLSGMLDLLKQYGMPQDFLQYQPSAESVMG